MYFEVIVLCYVDVMESCCVVPNRSVVVVLVVMNLSSLKRERKEKKTERRIVKNHVTFAEFGFA